VSIVRGPARVPQSTPVEILGDSIDAALQPPPDTMDARTLSRQSILNERHRQLGSARSTCRYLMQSLAMVHLAPSATHLGTRVSIHSHGTERAATVVRTPFYDPLRLRTHPEARGR
jgi:Glycine cleavage T-protein C-terminal barrel domain